MYPAADPLLKQAHVPSRRRTSMNAVDLAPFPQLGGDLQCLIPIEHTRGLVDQGHHLDQHDHHDHFLTPAVDQELLVKIHYLIAQGQGQLVLDSKSF